MIDYSRQHTSGLSLGAVLFASFALVACFSKRQQQAAPTEAIAATDAKSMERMERMRARALRAPGSASAAADYAFSVTLLYNQGVAKRRNVAPTVVDEVLKCLDGAKEAMPDEAPDLLAHEGELLLAAGRTEEGLRTLRDSIAARPNLRAFALLGKSYQARNQTAEIEPLCKTTLPAMKSEESRYAVLDDCIKYSGAASIEKGLRWAPAEEVRFYKARRHELEARSAHAAKQHRAKEEQ